MQPRIQRRIETLKLLVWTVVLILVAAYGWVQVVKRREMRDLAERQALKNRATPAPRGIIFDRNGDKLVDNQRSLHLVIQAEELPKDMAQVEELAQFLEQDSESLKRRIAMSRRAGGNHLVVLRDNLDDAGLAQAEMLRARFPFLSIQIAPRRTYLGGDLAGHALGYVGEVDETTLKSFPDRYHLGEIIGRTGFEASHNDDIRGEDGMRQILVDHLGREMAVYGVQEPKVGRSVYLTLDAGLQQVVKEAFAEADENGAAVVLDLRDGGILAMYSAPSVDPNVFLNRLNQEQVDYFMRNPVKPMMNRVTQGLYAPGSTFKLLIALCAMEKGILKPETTFHCAGRKTFYNREFRCDAVHGTLNLTQAIAHSCNIYFWELGMRLDVDEINATAQKYGLLEKTGIDLPRESVSFVPSREWARTRRPKEPRWYPGETISVAIGQGQNVVTPLALARFYAMLATGGKLITPHLLYGWRDESTGKMLPFTPSAPREAGLDPRVHQVLEEALYQVVKAGTAKSANLVGVDILGKTGTAQVRALGANREASRRQEKRFRDHALFAGFAPREHPQIAFAIVAENAGFGGATSAPIAKKLCEYWFLTRPVKRRPPPQNKLPESLRIAPASGESAP
ncbi:MAG: penicillin-binding protein 2 [Firmicutes bacterium]|nr:penicillin-binding protein 2 [Bacillota bacterium]